MTAAEKTQCRGALLIVMAAGFATGFFVWQSYFGYVPHLYPLKFKQGQWMTTRDSAPQAYFRKELYIPDSVLQAAVMVAATDSFVLYVNGRAVGAKDQGILNVAGIHDIGPYLHPGKNVIGLQVRRVTYPGPARGILEGTYFDYLRREHLIVSDNSWKASSWEESQANGRSPWHTVQFLADAWPSVLASGVPSPSEVVSVDFHPDLLFSLPYGNWVGHADPTVRRATFNQTFAVTQRVSGAWVRLAAVDSYELTINGINVGRSDASNKTLDIYDIGPFLKKGTNTIQVSVVAIRDSAVRLLLDGMISVGDQSEAIFASDSLWQTKDSDSGYIAPATILPTYAATIGDLVKNHLDTTAPILYVIKQKMYMFTFILLVTWIAILSWVFSAILISHVQQNTTMYESLRIDSLSYLLPLLFFSIIYLLQYDVRFDSAFPFQQHFIFFALGLLLIFKSITIFKFMLYRSDSIQKTELVSQLLLFIRKHHIFLVVICLISITATGLILRLPQLDGKSLSHDEAGIPIRAKAVLERGYPITTIGPIEKPMTTYELLPYPVALSIALFGTTDWAVRLPALLFSTLTLLAIFHIGLQFWGVWAGILAAAIYAFSPFAITWGSNAFHPQQTQFFALLTTYLFHKALMAESRVIAPKYLWGSSACFALTYLSWEASAFLLPALFISLLAVKGRNLEWLRCKQLWLAVVAVSAVVFLQLCVRILWNAPYIMVGKGLSDTTITLFFLDPLYNPWFYVQKFLFAGIHVPLTVLLLVGLPVVLKNRDILYYFVVMATLLLLLTNFLPNQTLRYTYFFLPLLILPSAAISIRFIYYILNFEVPVVSLSSIMLKLIFSFLFISTLFYSTNNFIIQIYRIGASEDWITAMLPEMYGIDYRGTSHFIKEHASRGDAIIAFMPHTLEYYINQESDYYLQTYTNRQIFYDVSEISGRYLDKYVGKPVIRNLGELMEVVNAHQRTWLVATPFESLVLSNDRQVLDYINDHSKVVYESYKSKVYRWQQ
jgi:hypothetical protein